MPPLDAIGAGYKLMHAISPDLWQLVKRGGDVDAIALLRAIASTPRDDHRTELLRRDALRALTKLWGEPLLRLRLNLLQADAVMEARRPFCADEEIGFPSLELRTMETTHPNDVRSMLRELGGHVRSPTQLIIGGSIALIIAGLIVQATEDIDVVDEVPEPIRKQHDLLAEYTRRYGLQLTHFQSHYLPDGWRSRVKSIGRFDLIDAYIVDACDVLAGKLFSRRAKDLDHIRHAMKLLDLESLRARIAEATATYRRDDKLLELGTKNWYVLTGEAALPPLRVD